MDKLGKIIIIGFAVIGLIVGGCVYNGYKCEQRFERAVRIAPQLTEEEYNIVAEREGLELSYADAYAIAQSEEAEAARENRYNEICGKIR